MFKQNLIQQAANESERNCYDLLHSSRAKPLFFKRFFKDDKLKQFPIANGYPICSIFCIEPNCIIYIPYDNMNSSILRQLLKGQKIPCKYKGCTAVFTMQTLSYENHLEALLDRNVTEADKAQLGTVQISNNYQIIVQRDERWNRLIKQLDYIRLEKLSQLMPQIKQNESNQVEGQAIGIDTQHIYSSIEKELIQFETGTAPQEMKEIEKREQVQTVSTCSVEAHKIDTCLIYRDKKNGDYRIGRYFSEANKASTSFSLLGVPNLENLTIAYDKEGKDIYFISEKGSLFHTRIDDKEEKLKVAKLGNLQVRTGKYQTKNMQLSQFALILHNAFLYIIGGKMNGQYVKSVYRFKVRNYVVKTSTESRIPLDHCYDLKRARGMCGVCADGDQIVVCGGCQENLSPMSAVNNVEVIDTTKIQNGSNKSTAVQVLSGKQFMISSPAISLIEPGKFALFGGYFDCKTLHSNCENRLIKIFDLKRGVFFQKEVKDYQVLEFTNLGYQDCICDGVTVFARTLLKSRRQFSFIKVEKIDEDTYQVLHELKTLDF